MLKKPTPIDPPDRRRPPVTPVSIGRWTLRIVVLSLTA